MNSDSKKLNATSPSSAAETALEAHRSLGAAAALHFAPLREAGNPAQPIAPGERAKPTGTDEMEPLVRGMLELIGEEPEREGLEKTPHRVAKAMRFLTSGYTADVSEVVNGAVFDSEGMRRWSS